jgi:hypothetical protein
MLAVLTISGLLEAGAGDVPIKRGDAVLVTAHHLLSTPYPTRLIHTIRSLEGTADIVNSPYLWVETYILHHSLSSQREAICISVLPMTRAGRLY